jgi:hypothetical protein
MSEAIAIATASGIATAAEAAGVGVGVGAGARVGTGAGAAQEPEPARRPLDARTLLARIDRRIVELRRALGHAHADEAYWEAFGISAPRAQSQRAYLRVVADLLHVERATRRGRVHGTRFATLDDQRAWLARYENLTCCRTAKDLGLPGDATLARLRAGELFAPEVDA